jgi:predicted acetyltransferase
MTTSPNSFRVLAASEEHRPLLEQLWTMFRHDMSAFTGALPDKAGRFRQERLDAALTEPGWAAYLFRLGSAPVGLAVVRGLDTDERIISSFFIVHGARRSGVGRAAVQHVTGLQPGSWSVAFQDSNTAASRFWPTVAAETDDCWTLERREVPGRPDLPADAWVHFNVRTEHLWAERGTTSIPSSP